MTPFTLKLEALPRRKLPRTTVALHQAMAQLWNCGALDSIREPAGLAYPMSSRARRLMRSARVAGG